MNPTDRLAAQRYALAYDALSTSIAEAKLAADNLRSAVVALQKVQTYMADPRIMLAAKKEWVRAALSAAPQTASFVELLLEAKRYKLLADISARVDSLLDERQGVLRAEVISARALTGAQQEKTEQTLSSRYGKTVKAVFRVDAKLGGGLLIYCNGERLDGSLSGRLKKLQEELING